MPYYETVFIARQDLTDAQVKALGDGFSKIITDAGGTIHKTENWGLRTLAYKMNKNRKGHYTLIEVDAPASAVIEMERQMRLHDDVVRYLTVREEELSKGPSPVMRKESNDDKPRRDRKEEAA